MRDATLTALQRLAMTDEVVHASLGLRGRVPGDDEDVMLAMIQRLSEDRARLIRDLTTHMVRCPQPVVFPLPLDGSKP